MENVMSQPEGKFPSQPVVNPKGQYEIGSNSNQEQYHEQAKSIITLRSGKQIENKVDMPREESKSNAEDQNEIERHTSASKVQQHSDSPGTTHVSSYVPKAPFPQRLAPVKKGNNFNEILDMFKQVQINIPLLDAIKQVPAYAKFLKDLCTQKRKMNVHKKVFLAEQLSSMIQNNTPPKFRDPGAPTISCVIGEHKVQKALLDLRASVNLLPYSVYEQLGLGELKPTKITLQLADRYIKVPRGIIEDVLIQVDKFYFPVDFIVLDTQPVQNPTSQIPVILGRPFLATSNAIINCRNGVMKLSFGNMKIKLNVFNAAQQPADSEDICEVDMIESLVHESFLKSSEDALETCLAHFGMDFDIENSIQEVNALLDSTPIMETVKWKAKVEPLPPSESKPVPSIEKPPELDLKQLPKNLKYAFLGPSETLPVIRMSNLEKEQKNKLLKVLREYKAAIGWTIEDMKGVSPTLCMHRTDLEKNAETSHEMQRGLNPNIKKDGRAKVLRLLDAGIIPTEVLRVLDVKEIIRAEVLKLLDVYPVSNSTVQVVPNKSGIG
ncbi:uncharacterized protein LOC131230589 [Magnolia sinica]|uniref:uncharacterized protein LOC131230589 n=1 Tax=Magnolia sinica TaxID=86752 RepID=UPI0026594989|nr:uncharacterized protein LOC131230589 [Magnolia sinica]